MYPSGELKELARRKEAVRDRLALHRLQYMEAGERLARPIHVIDTLVAQWRRISPFAKLAALPLGLLLKKKLAPKASILSTAIKWLPTMFGAARAVAGMRQN